MEAKEAAKKTWKFIWKDDSIWSWIVSLILAFIIVKFIFFPLLSLGLGTSLPLVVVESESMHHPENFISNWFGALSSFSVWWNENHAWYESKGITEQDAESWRLRGGLEKGDIVVVYGRSSIKIGDIIIFNANQAHPIIHRVIGIETINNQTVYSTKGDNNQGQLEVEKNIPESAILGKAVFRIPKLGWLKLAIVELINYFKR